MTTHEHHQHRTPRPWYKDRPVTIALISGFFSTLMTMLNLIFKN